MTVELYDGIYQPIGFMCSVCRRNICDYSLYQPFGKEWLVIKKNHNYVINAYHPDIRKIELIQIVDFIPDEQSEDILKKYGKK